MEPTGRPDVPLPVGRLPDWFDPLLGAAAVLVSVAVARDADVAIIDPRLEPASLPVLLVTAVGAAGLALWRRRPLLGFLVTAACGTAVSAAGYFIGALSLVLLLQLFALAANGTRRQALVGLGLSSAAYLGLWLSGVPDLSLMDALIGIALSVGAAAVGEVTRLRGEHQQSLLHAAEARGAASAERAVAEERLRIARELHDVVAHCMSLIAVQAGVGAHVLRSNPAAAERALEVIADVSRDALTQTRSVVGLLRTGDDSQPSLPGLASLQPLLAGVREAGLTVDLAVVGDVRDLPPVVDLAAYRVLQESLTNAVKHASDRPVAVLLSYASDQLVVTVSSAVDPAAVRVLDPPGSGTSGFGLIGLRERARAVGGRLDAGPTADGGFTVRAQLPTARPVEVLA